MDDNTSTSRIEKGKYQRISGTAFSFEGGDLVTMLDFLMFGGDPSPNLTKVTKQEQ